MDHSPVHRYQTRANVALHSISQTSKDGQTPDDNDDPEIRFSQRNLSQSITRDHNMSDEILQDRIETLNHNKSLTYELFHMGKDLGLTGTDLQNFVDSEKQSVMREREREDEKEERREMREHELNLERLKVQAAQNSNNNAQHNHHSQNSGVRLKLPFLTDKDNPETWFWTFDTYCEENEITEEKKPTTLIYFLTGKSREIFFKMREEDRHNYSKIKAAIFEAYQLNAEEYRIKFRQTKREGRDSYKEHVQKLEYYLKKWIELSDIDQTYEDLFDLVLREQVLDTLPADISIFVKDREPQTAEEIGQIASQYELNRQKGNKVRLNPRDTRSAHSDNTDRNNKDGNKTKGNRVLTEEEKKRHISEGRCFFCSEKQHLSRNCPKKKNKAGAAMFSQKDKMSTMEKPLPKLCDSCQNKEFREEVKIKVNGQKVNALRDSGCTGIIVSRKLIFTEQISDKVQETVLAEKGISKFCQTAVVEIDCPYFIGKTEVTVMEEPLYDVLIGNWYGLGPEKSRTPIYPVRDPTWYQCTEEKTAMVITRSESRNKSIPVQSKLKRGKEILKEIIFSPEELKQNQQNDETLQKCREFAEKGDSLRGVTFLYKKGILYRSKLDKMGNEKKQVVVPKKMRDEILSVGHDKPMAGHLGRQKTTDRIESEFWWPGVIGDIKRYVLSCDTCQRTSPKGKVSKVPLGQVAIFQPAFKRVAIDLIGPIIPMSESKKQYILVQVDYCTRYPHAIALKDIHTETIVDALWDIWSQVGLPESIITDQGSQFTGKLMDQVTSLLQIKHKFTAPFNPQANGLVEKFNGCLKLMLKKLSIEQPRKWDSFIPAVLFAYREVPQASTGFSPFEMLYGRTVRGPLQVLRKIWTDEESTDEEKSNAQYVIDMKNQIEETCRIAKENLEKMKQVQTKYFDRKAKKRSLEVGQKVLILKPQKRNKLELIWQGPYEVTEKLNPFDYKIREGTKDRVYHINLLKEYIERENTKPAEPKEKSIKVAVVIEEDASLTDDNTDTDTQRKMPSLETNRTEDVSNIQFGIGLTEKQRQQALEICKKKEKHLTDVPLQTNLISCNIPVTDEKPIFVRTRPIPHALVGIVEDEVDEMIKLGVIEPAQSPYNAPIVMVKKDTGKYRFCCDFRALNNIVVFDGEPITDVEHLFQSLGKAKYFSKLDLTKGYWAIPIDEKDRDKTAFTTSKGQFRWVNMPFGLKTASGIFNRMMRKLLLPLRRNDVHHFMDDILIATETWEEHLEALEAVLERIEEANLAAKPSKCFIGFDQLPYLGHGIGNGKRWPEEDKIEKVQKAETPQTKKELRSFLGLTGFYRSYVENYSKISATLSNMTKKDRPEKLKWTEEEKKSFEKLKEAICKGPILRMPDEDKEFVLRTDASNYSIGAVLMQEFEGKLHPIAYQSRKLLDAETRYATVEKECLASVWGIQKFERYLYGRHFILETDHQPLKCLQKQPTNPRLTRWALQLQPYSFTVRVIAGKDNHGADFLSRANYQA